MLGPGRVPLILSVLLLVLGAIVAIEGFFHRGAGARGPIVPAILVAAAGAVFLLTVGLLGLAAATGLAAALVAGYSLRTRPVACVLVVVACVAAAVLLDLSKLFSSGGA